MLSFVRTAIASGQGSNRKGPTLGGGPVTKCSESVHGGMEIEAEVTKKIYIGSTS